MAVFKNGIFAVVDGQIINPVSNLVASIPCFNFFQTSGVLNLTQRSAVYQLVSDFQTYGIWDKMKAIYPMVGQAGVSSSFQLNLKDPTTFKGIFSGSWTYASTGVTGNGINTYMDTGIDISTLSQNSIHGSVYNGKTNLWEEKFLFGVYTNATNGLSANNYPNLTPQNGFIGSVNDLASDYTVDIANTGGVYLINRPSSTIKQHWIRNTKTQYTRASVTPTAGFNLILGANNNGGTITGFNTQENRLFTVGDGLTDTEASNLYTAVQRFQTTLGRQV
jgi:hypothetical protein